MRISHQNSEQMRAALDVVRWEVQPICAKNAKDPGFPLRLGVVNKLHSPF
jgi:hypothetical protein